MPLLGVVGKTNVGKSTFFSAATMVEVPIENRPFVTIDPNIGIGYVRVPCVHVKLGLPQCNPIDGFCMKGWRFIPVKLMDVAGLVPGASEGRGLGSQFLEKVSRSDALLIVVDASGSTDEEGNPVPPGSHDPTEDVKILLEEYVNWMFSQILKDWKSFSMKVDTSGESIEDALYKRLSGFKVKRDQIKLALDELSPPSKLSKWSQADIKSFIDKVVEFKPKVIVANKADLPQAESLIERLKEQLPYKVIPTSAAAEMILRKAAKEGYIEYVPGDADFTEVKTLSPKQKKVLETIRKNVLEKWGSTGVVQSLNTVVFDEMDMTVVYPVHDVNRYTDTEGRVLPEARLVKKGITVREFAGLIHSDFQKHFLYAIDALSSRKLGGEHRIDREMVIKIVSAKK
ncbi:translation-associated GTPase [Ignicoccus islandicus DSM 13165]|uniref:Translation-associated GTPase n=1 Tax=Ignicoccus islandicus DSM 13165 TaxID=940295 RepID=A0A0U2U5A9_9CREN|nr:redox-regulated ATPase YchF [Ignicoccus islandicus]ALU11364.1 translation-associated GTPase [Ignicoccus islandicus DSM 13165]